MNIKRYKNLCLFILAILFIASCSNNTKIANPSSDASIKALSIQYNDSSPKASTAVFTINDVDSLIFNKDSLPYGTKVDSLYLNITFSSSLGFVMNDTISESNYYTSTVTSNHFNFTKPVKITNLASDGKSTKTYQIEVRVHKVDPYLTTWSELNSNVLSLPAQNQKAVLLNNIFYFFHNYDSYNALYTSSDGINWSSQPAPSNLPLDAKIRQMLVYNDSILLLYNGNTIYKSANGIDWKKYTLSGDPNYDYQALLFSFKDKLWAVAQNKTDKTIRMASSLDGIHWNFSGQRTFTNFPVSDFASVSFKPTIGRKKVLVVGGINAQGNILNTRWSAEDVANSDTLYWVNLQNSYFKMDYIMKSGIEYYGNKLLLFGGTNDAGDVVDGKKQLRQSIDQGLTWVVPDSTQNLMPDHYVYRSNASIINDSKNNTLYIIGGNTDTKPLADVWKIKVNMYSFIDYYQDPSKY